MLSQVSQVTANILGSILVLEAIEKRCVWGGEILSNVRPYIGNIHVFSVS